MWYQYLLMLGEFNLADDDPAAIILLFFGATIVMLIVMLNLVIALMSDTYARVMTNIVVSDNRELNSMVVEYENLLFWKKNDSSEP